MEKRHHLKIDNSRVIPIARIEFSSGLSLKVVNDTMINVNELAEWIWSQQIDLRGEGPSRKVRRNYINAVKRKSLKAYEDGILPLLPPMANDIFVELEDLTFWLDKWCHRDSYAKDLLFSFNMGELKKDISMAMLKTLEKTVEEKQSAVQRLEEEIRAHQEEITRLKGV